MINIGCLVILSRPGSRAISGPVDSSLLLAAEWPRSKARGRRDHTLLHDSVLKTM